MEDSTDVPSLLAQLKLLASKQVPLPQLLTIDDPQGEFHLAKRKVLEIVESSTELFADSDSSARQKRRLIHRAKHVVDKSSRRCILLN